MIASPSSVYVSMDKVHLKAAWREAREKTPKQTTKKKTWTDSPSISLEYSHVFLSLVML